MENPLTTLSFNGGWLSLDFTNTVSARQPAKGEEYLNTWDDFALWVERSGMFSGSDLTAWKKMPPGDMSEVWGLREALYEMFRYVADHGIVSVAHLDVLNGFLHETYAHTGLRMSGSGIRRDVDEAPHPDKPLWLIVLSAEALLLGGRFERVRACANCGWLFLDTSKNGTRRWCDMSTCGSQSKAKAYYHRRKNAAT